MDLKTLKKLSAACRKAGIKTYKCAEFEITLADSTPTTSYKRSKEKKLSNQPLIPSSDRIDEIDSDGLTEDQLLFWSATAEEEEGLGAQKSPKGQ